EPPPGLSKAKLRAWKRRQKILAKDGADRIGLLMGQRDSTAAAAAQEASAESKGEAPEAAKEGAPQVAAWEAKWNSAAEKTETVDLDVLKALGGGDASAVAEDPVPDASTQGLRQRKGDVAAKPTQATETEARPEDREVASESESVAKLREKLRQDRWRLREFWLRQFVLVVGTVIAALACVESGAVVDLEDFSRFLVEEDMKQVPQDEIEDEAFEFELSFDIQETPRETPLGEPPSVSLPAPGGGWCSIPVMLLALRAAIHLFRASRLRARLAPKSRCLL
ncbi:Hypothetical protein SCF082_LOCUS20381, partial [Durusdinium trenchii]